MLSHCSRGLNLETRPLAIHELNRTFFFQSPRGSANINGS